MTWITFDSLKMARIYFTCPFCSSNGNSLYSLGRWIVAGLFLIIVLLMLLPFRQMFTRPYSSYDNTVSDTNYGIVIDCGSSGSRVYVYHWPPHSGNSNELLHVQQLEDGNGEAVVKKVSPGLSSFENNPDDASDHIKELLLFAQKFIPREKHKETFLYVMATAGMRMLSERSQKAILADLQTDIKAEFDFVAPENHFEVISGKQEGVYAWIAINYVLDRFSHSEENEEGTILVTQPSVGGSEKPHLRKRTVGMIDMGGGSVQIAFEVTNPNQIKELPGHLVSEVNLGCQDSDTEHRYKVYVTTFLGYGANSARERYEEMLIKNAAVLGRRGTAKDPLPDVCLPNGMTQVAEDKAGVTYNLIGTGRFDDCLEAVNPLLNKSVPCLKSPCSINGMHQPDIDLHNSFYGFSEFWYSTEDVFRMGGLYNYQKFKRKGEEFCATSWSQLKAWYDQKLYPKADDHRFSFQCFKSAWMMEVFHHGFDFPTSYSKLTSAQLVRHKDVGWTLGALIHRTRFLPLRDIEMQKEMALSQTTSSWQRANRWLDTQFLFIICFLIVVMAIILYMKHLRLCPQKAAITRVPSMSYFMTEQDQLEQGVRTVKSQGFIL